MTTDSNVNIMLTGEHGSLTITTTHDTAASVVQAILNMCERVSIPDIYGVTHVLSGTFFTNSYIRIERVA